MFVQRFPARKWNEANGVQNENEENRMEIINVYLLRDWVVIIAIITSNSIVATTLNQRQYFYIIVEIYLSITIYAYKC